VGNCSIDSQANFGLGLETISKKTSWQNEFDGQVNVERPTNQVKSTIAESYGRQQNRVSPTALAATTYDYPPPKTVIQTFNGDP